LRKKRAVPSGRPRTKRDRFLVHVSACLNSPETAISRPRPSSFIAVSLNSEKNHGENRSRYLFCVALSLFQISRYKESHKTVAKIFKVALIIISEKHSKNESYFREFLVSVCENKTGVECILNSFQGSPMFSHII